MNITQRYGTVLRCYVGPGNVADRYTILPPRWAREHYDGGTWNAIGCSAEPFHPQGVGMHCTAHAGAHLGVRVQWDTLPEDVRKFAAQSFPEYAP